MQQKNLLRNPLEVYKWFW